MPAARRPRSVSLLAGVLLLALAPPLGADTPAGFTDTLLFAVPYPTGLAFTPDARMLVTTQPGLLRVHAGGALLPTPALDLSAKICNNAERGLLGVAVDPGFAANQLIYLFYTFNLFASPSPCPVGTTGQIPVNRVSRFVLPPSNVIDPASEVVLLDNIPSPGGNHNAGDVQLGADGLLYVTTGDGAITPNNARLLSSLSGKVLRIASDGSIPPANPYAAAPGSRRCGDPAGPPGGTGPCAEVFAYGLRNPFRIAFRPGTDEFYINDVGANLWEEIDLGAANADYGWNVREGPCSSFMPSDCGPPPAGMTNPIHAYNHSTGCSSITGGAFVPVGVWPAPYDGSYLFADLVCGRIFRLEPDGAGGFNAIDFMTNLGAGSVVAMAFGPDGATRSLYYTDYVQTGANGEVHRVAYVGGANRPPSGVIAAAPRFGPTPLDVNFDAAGSLDPDLDPITYDWDFGDGGRQTGLTVPTTAYAYTTSGVWTASLIVRDDRGGVSTPVTLRIDAGNTPPLPAIAFPTAATRFAVGRTIVLQGSATDPEDGLLPDASLTWEVLLHHVDELLPANRHTHPLLAPTAGNNVAFNPPAPEDLQATRLSYLEVRLSAVDSWGVTATVMQDLEPNRVDLGFATVPAGLQLLLAGRAGATPSAALSWEAFALPVLAPLQEDGGGLAWRFSSWSDGGAAAHSIVSPAIASAYTATFVPGGDLAHAPALLRNDAIADLATAAARFAAIFSRAPRDPSLDAFGPDRVGDAGEGSLLGQNGSADDDDLYAADPVPVGWLETETAVLADASRPLVLYQLDQPGRTLALTKLAGGIRVAY